MITGRGETEKDALVDHDNYLITLMKRCRGVGICLNPDKIILLKIMYIFRPYNFTLDFSCLLLCVYLSCDNYSSVYINQEYSECIYYIESLYNNSNCNAFICCGDYNTSFERLNAQTECCINNFISRCNFVASWDHQVSKK